MSDLFDMVSDQLLSGDVVRQMSRRIGADEGATATALQGAIPALLGGLARNSQQAGGASALAGALDRDHDGSVLDDVAGFLGGGGDAGILGHVFGGRQGSVAGSLSKMSGLDGGQITQLLALAAPLIMGYLGREKRQQGFDAGGLGDLLGGARQSMESRQPDAMRMLGGLLDSDGDGSVMDDVANLGSGLLGGLFKKR
jgi:hypothetical protein